MGGCPDMKRQRVRGVPHSMDGIQKKPLVKGVVLSWKLKNERPTIA